METYRAILPGRNEEQLQESDLRPIRDNLIKNLRKLSLTIPEEATDEEWKGTASSTLQDYENIVGKWYTEHKFYSQGTSKKKWTFSNAVVYCATIYTTMGKI